jgi:tetratricopeptide (TPR) repeat protein
MKWSLRIIRVAGTDIFVHASFVLLLIYVLFAIQPDSLLQALLAVSWIIIVFLCVALHELGHSVTANLCGIPVRHIVLWPLGGFAVLPHEPETPQQEMLISSAGPLVNIVLALAAWGLSAVLTPLVPAGAAGAADSSLLLSSSLLFELAFVNAVLGLFNLIPAYPLDGGRLALAALTWMAGRERARVLLRRLTGLVGGAFLLAGIGLGNVLLLVVGLLIVLGSSTLSRRLGSLVAHWQAYLFDRGAFYLRRGDYARAIQQLDSSIAREPTAANYSNRGFAYAGQGEYARAIADYDTALLLQPHDADAYYHRAEAYAEQQQYSQAIDDYSQAIALQPDFYPAFIGRGTAIFYAAGDARQAEADYRRALACNPTVALAHSNLGFMLLLQGQPEEAITACNQSVLLAADSAMAYGNRAAACHALGRYRQTIVDCDRAVRYDPTEPGYYLLRGSAYYALGDHESALAECHLTVQRGLPTALVETSDISAIKMSPGWVWAYYDAMLALRPNDERTQHGRSIAEQLCCRSPAPETAGPPAC